MTTKLLIILLLTSLTIQCFSQADFSIRRQRLTPHNIDTATENVFIYESPKAIVYFSQHDINDFLSNPKSKQLIGNFQIKVLQDTLQTNTKSIKIKDVLHYYTDQQRDSINNIEPINGRTKQLNEDFYFVGAALMLKGKFMVYSKDKKAFVTKELVASKHKDMLGNETLEFYLPDRKQFYYIITALGE